MSFCVMDRDMQPQGQVQIIISTADYGLEIQSAGDAPRWHHIGSSEPRWTRMMPGSGQPAIAAGSGVPAETRKRLAQIDWMIGKPDGSFGRYQFFEHPMGRATRVYAATSEHRIDRPD